MSRGRRLGAMVGVGEVDEIGACAVVAWVLGMRVGEEFDGAPGDFVV